MVAGNGAGVADFQAAGAQAAGVPVEWCFGGRELGEPRVHPSASAVGYLSGSGSATALWWHPLDGRPAWQLTSVPAPRSARGLGGGVWSWTAAGDGVLFVAGDGQVWLQHLHAGPRRITWHDEGQASCPSPTPDGAWVVYALDDASIWRAPLTPDATSAPAAKRLDRGDADFVVDPVVMPCGAGAMWIAWDVPDMPWDAARVVRATFDGETYDDGRPPNSIQQIRPLADGRALAVQDDHGWLNVWIAGERPIVDEPIEHAGPAWGPGQRSFCASPDERSVAFTRNELGFGRLCVAEISTGEVREVGRGVHGQLSWAGDHLVAVRTGARTPPEVVVYDTITWERRQLAIGSVGGWQHAALAEPELLQVGGDAGMVPARLYRADGHSDRLLCWIHGGPTDQWQVTFQPRVAYWRAQGWNVVVPDHRGSTGHGRVFQQSLRGQWGVADVADVAAVLDHCYRHSIGTPVTTFVVGGSAGGFTALEVLADGGVEIAGVAVSYPVSDLIDLTVRSHRFERHYTDTLVGSLPDATQTMIDRSPLHHPQRLTRRPILLLHGDTDPVVPVEQSERLAAAVNTAGGRAELHVFTGEGHGFRHPANQTEEYRLLADFFARHGG